ncbi:MAG: hydrogenase nickel incorporation protein HypB [Anaerolineae bacterium]|nr:hydrogenase nickel incorporation protein HypB [Anaerolineae bacterium]
MTDSSNITVEEKIMDANEKLALDNHEQFNAAGVFALNMMASPGGGKTSVILKTVKALSSECRIGVLDGDVVDIDLRELRTMDIPVSLINTGGSCHLDANMVHSALPDLPLNDLDLLIIENVGNLICPMAFDLGVHRRVVIASVPEGSDKPYKYPNMFRGAEVLLLNKMDLQEYMEFDVEYFKHGVEVLNPGVAFFPISCRTGEGFDAWLDWLRAQLAAHASERSASR